jgi:hypothetical protein
MQSPATPVLSWTSRPGHLQVWGKRPEVGQKLLQIWQRCAMVRLVRVETDPALNDNDQAVPVDPVLNTRIPTTVEVFATHCENFDFQEHSVLCSSFSSPCFAPAVQL